MPPSVSCARTTGGDRDLERLGHGLHRVGHVDARRGALDGVGVAVLGGGGLATRAPSVKPSATPLTLPRPTWCTVGESPSLTWAPMLVVALPIAIWTLLPMAEQYDGARRSDPGRRCSPFLPGSGLPFIASVADVTALFFFGRGALAVSPLPRTSHRSPTCRWNSRRGLPNTMAAPPTATTKALFHPASPFWCPTISTPSDFTEKYGSSLPERASNTKTVVPGRPSSCASGLIAAMVSRQLLMVNAAGPEARFVGVEAFGGAADGVGGAVQRHLGLSAQAFA